MSDAGPFGIKLPAGALVHTTRRAMAEAAERRRRRLRVKSLVVLSDLIELSPDELFKASIDDVH